ncbi:hypothetical protein A2899_01480 [Candidatus Amesbacteria bacterium RIFCSPLOWO2_01_FULL_49_25]|uniref:Uncharacterized protein n=1 Tax=Candidatus Amesbacteria bacterium RIFCSPHIGHO2_01_FULL_48_32b TaxID=1797253 RepID=A0A1F4YD94_9BACT|nr:MAG: hypothetical protein A2876_03140 [Candidatus Amesbacteria bacterium RIFCSPHIGHO2_01_FULL_48_32b]OGD08447.1 MAG: hypothetical protein A2899_01480 [Candidatus Amesbacteria bacterium RIFCSPLOWO2_01_FULL_49_25]
MHDFQFHHPTKVIFSVGSIENSGNESAAFGKRALIITSGQATLKIGILNRLIEILKKSNINVFSLDPFQGEPSVTYVDSAVKQATEYEPDLVIGLGGGSAIDAAKAISACLASSRNITYFLSNPLVVQQALPIVAIPTTIGSGSEVSRGSVITDVTQNIKRGLYNDFLIPKLAIIDPQLSITLPPRATALIGFDLLSAAIESFFSRKSNLYTHMLSLEIISKVYQNLPAAVKDGSNLEARINLAFASLLTGYNLVYSGTCLPHRIQYALGSHPGMTHPLGIAALFPAWFSLAAKTEPAKLASISKAIGVSESQVVKTLLAFRNELKINVHLADFHILSPDIPQLVNKVGGDLKSDPAYKGNKTIEFILTQSL